MEMCRFGLVLLLVLCAALLAEAQPDGVAHRYSNFLNQHVYAGMTSNRCDSVIGSRGIETVLPNGKRSCKQRNTFILANSDQVRAVCGNAMKDYESGQPFRVVTCKLHSGERPPHCEYRGHEDRRYITISCEQGWPVHYPGDTVVVG
ncbi:ribonuclease-like 3 [Pangasianodon hypophthalmus]|uniref:ribonuclease-like 3 n=1 Tax=Pangasianodon hypophthalmus TaxID=310915 RepID=UPI000EFF050A|nr:ribonuclease-like 3 [Pangasianodon hypophthalmus]XP_053086287.1 ribonuclease-like 3 [Pangasianodon hypophthalmus]XP_053086288.1 ribonuclease-like 3 [Pangasianodon hypophthalmus]XP_053086289.1 ribonuclease-like 3 [Pangasianodon hypophthalmus]